MLNYQKNSHLAKLPCNGLEIQTVIQKFTVLGYF